MPHGQLASSRALRHSSDMPNRKKQLQKPPAETASSAPKATTEKEEKRPDKPLRDIARAADWAPAYLAALAIDGRITKAADDAGISRLAVFERSKSDPAFIEAEQRAIDVATAQWESEAIKRALEGVQEPVFYKGVVVGHVSKLSDGILLRLLETRLPHWRPKQQLDVTSQGNPIYGTRAVRRAHLEKARAEIRMPLG